MTVVLCGVGEHAHTFLTLKKGFWHRKTRINQKLGYYQQVKMYIFHEYLPPVMHTFYILLSMWICTSGDSVKQFQM